MRLSILLLLIVFSSSIFSQPDRRKDSREKIEALEKIKLLETLNMDEETTLKFFARRNEHQAKVEALFDELDSQLEKIESKISSSDDDNNPELKKLVDNYFSTHQKINDERKRFLNSLTDILTNKQLAQLTLFERRFKEEIRKVLFHKKKRMMD
jgi:gas vesicle protein